MDTFSLFTHLPRPTIFAHRGASAYGPENTLAAFELAIQQGADAIELDAKLCADEQVVVIHDQSVDRTTGSKGFVGELSLADLQQMDAGSHFDIAFCGEPIPTLEEVFEVFGRRTYINVELSNYASLTDALPIKVAGLVRKHHLENRVIFTSFNPIALWRVRRLLPKVPTGLLAMPGRSGSLARSRLGTILGYAALHPHYRDVTPALVESTHRRGCRIHPFTVNRLEDMRSLFDMGVDGLITDDPMLARQALASVRG